MFVGRQTEAQRDDEEQGRAAKGNQPHLKLDVAGNHHEDQTNREEGDADDEVRFALDLVFLLGGADGVLEVFGIEDQEEDKELDDAAKDGRDRHDLEIIDEADARGGRQIDVGRVADDEHHGPSVGRGEFGDEIRQRVDLRVFGEETKKGRQRQNDDVVRGEDGQNRGQGIEDEKEVQLAVLGFAGRQGSEITEEAHLVKVDREDGHREKQDEDLEGVDAALGDELPAGFLNRGERGRGEEDRAEQSDQPIGAQMDLPELDGRKENGG